ncbi:MAG: acetyl-CoA hydrolase/transferase C-terminal domain-containing protein [Oleiphilaceae bacterium]|nr:acetyl-CoA hydrolase/transferase C-terminal domain-containing protein [Oleiphilaceae bacterium]
MATLKHVDVAVEQTIQRVGKHVVLGLPLGLGKPNQLVNAFYRRAVADRSMTLRIITALSLEKPRPKNDTEARFLIPFVERLFGDYEELEYMKAMRNGALPDNIEVSEFYFKAGAMKNQLDAQRNYISSNYTFVARDLMINGVNVLAQLVAKAEVDGETRLSLSCNTDVTLDLMPLIEEAREQGKPIVTLAQVHDELPFMYNRAMVDTDFFDMVVHNPQYNTTLFAPPNMSVPNADYMAGFHASTLIKDGGTLQIGIGSLGDAIVYACQLRHEQPAVYQGVVKELECNDQLIASEGGVEPFEQGLYGCSEMFVNGFMHLIRSGIVKRKVFDDRDLQSLLNEGKIDEQISPETLRVLLEEGIINTQLSHSDAQYLQYWGIVKPELEWSEASLRIGETSLPNDLSDAQTFSQFCEIALGERLKHGVHMHGGFFLGPQDFYQTLRALPHEESEKICMSSVGHINQLAFNHALFSLQRRHARFINTGMMVTLSGAVVSDGLEDGTVISGVGGQYNFVAQAHGLPDARSILCVRSTRGSGKSLASNIVPHYGHVTIPRHLRDIVVTEYGVADLRGKTDEEIAIALIEIADSRFQEDLVAEAIKRGKLRESYRIPDARRENTPERIKAILAAQREQGFFPPFPLGSDFTDEEIALGKSLKEIKALMESPKRMLRAVIKAFIQKVDVDEARPFLKRLDLEHPETAKEKLLQHLILLELEESGYLKPM